MFKPPVDSAHVAASRLDIVESLVPLAVDDVSRQMPSFIDRLAQALYKLSEQTVRPNEANVSFNAHNYLKKNAVVFQRGALAALTAALLDEIANLHNLGTSITELDLRDMTLVSLEEMENKVLIGTISQAIELTNASALVALNIRLGRLVQRAEISIAQNPFRPAVFVRALFDAWCKFDPQEDTHRLVLRLFRPEIFFDCAPLLAELNQSLITRGIVPNLAEAIRQSKSSYKPRASPEVERRDVSLKNKVNRWLQTPAVDDVGDKKQTGSEPPLPDRSGLESATKSAMAPSHILTSYLADWQFPRPQGPAAIDAACAKSRAGMLRDIVHDAPSDALGAQERNIIELLARVFEFIFSDVSIPEPLKKLLTQLQLPLLKTALVDKDFFYSEDHPARRLLDQLAQSTVGMQPDASADDPLYKIIGQLIDRVQREFDQQLDLYTDVAADLQSFLSDQERSATSALATHIAEALHEELMKQAQHTAENDIAARIETGEVAGFVEVFLETQWLRVLTLTHSVGKRKPKALANALKAMDELIWSVKPKLSSEERAALITRLPSMLSLINAWLNVIKWDAPERVHFFSKLVERHAAVVRGPIELTPRHQLHLAVNVAQKASEWRLSRRARELNAPPVDQFVHQVDSLEIGRWIEFIRHNGVATPFRLLWHSPLRSRFIFCNHQYGEPFSFTADELALALREQGATLLALESVSKRALSAALDQLDRGT